MTEKKKGSASAKLGRISAIFLMASACAFVVGFAAHWYWFLLSVGWWLAGKWLGV